MPVQSRNPRYPAGPPIDNRLSFNGLTLPRPVAHRLPFNWKQGFSVIQPNVPYIGQWRASQVQTAATQTVPTLLSEGRRQAVFPTIQSGPRLRLLLVEDNPVDAMRIRQLMARTKTAAFAIDSVACLGAAAERLTAGGADLVLLDLDLPDSLGLATFAALAATAPTVPVVVLCRPGDEPLGMEAVQLGAQPGLAAGPQGRRQAPRDRQTAGGRAARRRRSRRRPGG